MSKEEKTHQSKLIDIPKHDGTFKRLKIKSAEADKDLKTYIQDLLIEHVKE